MGPKKFRENTLKELEKEPMTMGGLVIKHAGSEKYLGDWVNELGCKQSIDDTIKERMRKLTSKANDIIMLAEAPNMSLWTILNKLEVCLGQPIDFYYLL